MFFGVRLALDANNLASCPAKTPISKEFESENAALVALKGGFAVLFKLWSYIYPTQIF